MSDQRQFIPQQPNGPPVRSVPEFDLPQVHKGRSTATAFKIVNIRQLANFTAWFANEATSPNVATFISFKHLRQQGIIEVKGYSLGSCHAPKFC